MIMWTRWLLAASLGTSALVWLDARDVQACGGTFCDTGPQAAPVDQTGETILFALDGDFVEAHVQIEYDGGDASKFAWIVPLPEIPEVEVGSWRLVQNVLDATVPVYGFQDGDRCSDGSPGSGFIDTQDGGGGGPPQVVAHDVVGAFEYVVLQGGTAASLMAWLEDNDYAGVPEAPEIFDAYIAEGHVFAAFKLRHGAHVEDIHPVVIRYPGDEACIPIRLTRVAAREDMDIRALFLGDVRVMPINYKHVLLNRVRLDWVNLGANYGELVSMAVDEGGGRAFVTEYAGTSRTVATDNLATDGLDASVFTNLHPVQVVDALTQQGLMQCFELSCSYAHELVPSLLHEFVPVPAGMEEHEFYHCLSCNAPLIDHDAWDGAAFSQAFRERITDPLDHARELLAMWPYVTRLYTRISPHEMLSDPMFGETPNMPDVAHRHGAERNDDCCRVTMRLPGGREVRMPNRSTWPELPAQMPWAERVEEFQPVGPPVTMVDNTPLIDTLLEVHNAQEGCSEDDTDGRGDGGWDSRGDGGGGDGQGDSTSGGTGGTGALEGGSGCACRSAPGPGGAPSALFLMLAGVALRRRS
jgi:MYXO-CTERM domain-containing protein